jgi:hypothetical protein
MSNAPESSSVTRLLDLAEALRQGEASSLAEGVDPNSNPTYVSVKARLLAGEITLSEAHTIIDAAFVQPPSL